MESIKKLIKKIAGSMLTLNQKIYAIKTFAIPQLDYILTNKRIDLKTADEIDRLIMVSINKHIKGVRLPVSVFYTHWKDRGLSLTKLKERAICLRAKTFMALYNTQSTKVRIAMRQFAESERKRRKIDTLKDEDEEEIFLNWKVEENMRNGTDTIVIHALRSIKKLNIRFEVDEDTDNITAIIKQIDISEPQIPKETIGEPTEKFIRITSPKELLQHVMKNIRIQYRENLVSNGATGHSFIDLQNSPFANKFICDYTHQLNDHIASWIIKARCNLLFTGSLGLKTRIPKEHVPRCQYCNTIGDDTLSHRINGRVNSRTAQTRRHNNIQNIVMKYMKARKTRSEHEVQNKHHIEH